MCNTNIWLFLPTHPFTLTPSETKAFWAVSIKLIIYKIITNFVHEKNSLSQLNTFNHNGCKPYPPPPNREGIEPTLHFTKKWFHSDRQQAEPCVWLWSAKVTRSVVVLSLPFEKERGCDPGSAAAEHRTTTGPKHTTGRPAVFESPAHGNCPLFSIVSASIMFFIIQPNLYATRSPGLSPAFTCIPVLVLCVHMLDTGPVLTDRYLAYIPSFFLMTEYATKHVYTTSWKVQQYSPMAKNVKLGTSTRLPV